MKNTNSFTKVHPMIIFWLGVLTGALILGVVFMERMMNMTEYQSALYKLNPKANNEVIEKVPKDLYVPKSFKFTAPELKSNKSELNKLGPDTKMGVNPVPVP